MEDNRLNNGGGYINRSGDNHANRGLWGLLVAFALIIGLVGLIISIVALSNRGNTTGSSLFHPGDGSIGSISGVVDKVKSAVVSIHIENKDAQGQPTEGQGTGFIVSSDGIIMTSKHVVDKVQKVSIEADNGDFYENVRTIGIDPLNDVAYLKLDGVSGLPTVTLGDSKNNLVGMPIIVVGYALGAYPNSVTSGIISAVGREVTANTSTGEVYEQLADLAQIDAAVNPGNSGGPVLNANGEVIGISTAAIPQGAQGIGFAIPINSAKGMLRNIQQNGRAQRADLGLKYVNLNSNNASALNLTTKHGAYIYSGDASSAIVAGGPAASAGLRDGDIITAVNGTEIGIKGTLLTLVSEHMPGETVSLSILRGTERLTLQLTLGAMPQ